MVGVGSEWGEWSGSDGSSRGTRGLPISVTPSSLRRAVGVGLHHLFTVACAFRLFWSASCSSSSIYLSPPLLPSFLPFQLIAQSSHSSFSLVSFLEQQIISSRGVSVLLCVEEAD